ncbi:MAG: autotransporter assembly complex family protein [Pseudomonadota bacterium]
MKRYLAALLVLLAGCSGLEPMPGPELPPPRAGDITRIDVRIEVDAPRNGAALRSNLVLFLSVNQSARALASGERTGVSPTLFRRQVQRAAEEARQALAPFGFYDPRSEVQVEGEAERRSVRLNVNPGPQTVLRSVVIELSGSGADQPELERLQNASGLEPQAPLRHAAYDGAKQRLLETALALGYLDAAFATAELKVYPEARAADVRLQLNTGERYRFGPIVVEQDILRPQFVDRLVNVEPGAVFDVQQLIDLQLLLNDTDYFANVHIDADHERAADHQVPVTVHTQAQASQAYRTGIGYGTDTGPRASLGVDLRRLNRRGHQFSADLRGSAIRNTLATEYRIPIKDVARDRFRLFARLDEAQIGDSDSDQFSLGASREDSWLGLRRQLYLRYNGERFSFGSAPSDESRLLMPGISLSYDRADDRVFVRRGFSVRVDTHGAIESLASDTTFLSTLLSLRLVRPLGPRSRFLLGAELGYLEVDDFDALPPGERFFTGGDRTVRGYSFQSLAPENADGDVIGGTRLSMVTAEVDTLLVGNFGVAAFVDHGAASSSLGSDLSTGIGLGVRYRSPVGMIRIDFAHPLDDDDRAVRLHLTLGSDL